MLNYSRNQFKLTFFKDETLFYVNHERKTVSCVITSILRVPQPCDIHCCVGLGDKVIKSVGVAKCHEDDVFDIERGKRIALTRAEDNAYLKALNYMTDVNKHLTAFRNMIDSFTKQTVEQIKHDECYIESIGNPEHPKYKKELTPVKKDTTYIV